MSLTMKSREENTIEHRDMMRLFLRNQLTIAMNDAIIVIPSAWDILFNELKARCNVDIEKKSREENISTMDAIESSNMFMNSILIAKTVIKNKDMGVLL